MQWWDLGENMLFSKPFSLSTLRTTSLNPNALALLPGFCIAVPLLSVLKHGCFKESPDCGHEHLNFVPSFVPNNWPECLINMLTRVCAYTLPCLSSSSDLVLSCLFLALLFPQARMLHTLVYAHTGAIMPRIYAHIGVIMPTRICTHRRDQTHTYMHT